MLIVLFLVWEVEYKLMVIFGHVCLFFLNYAFAKQMGMLIGWRE